MTSPDPDRLVKAIYAKYREINTGFQTWEKLRPYTQAHWRCVANTARAVVEDEIRAAEEVRG